MDPIKIRWSQLRAPQLHHRPQVHSGKARAAPYRELHIGATGLPWAWHCRRGGLVLDGVWKKSEAH